MLTEAQINANRLNAQKFTAPTSPEGKARSSLNALKSGFDAWSHIIPREDPVELEALTAAFLLHFHPSDPIQLSLVDTLISTEWFQRRLRRIEAQLWNYQVECLDKNLSRADFLASIAHNSPSATPHRCHQPHVPPHPQSPPGISRPRLPGPSRPPPRFPNRHPFWQLNHLRHKLGSFRKVPLNPGNARM